MLQQDDKMILKSYPAGKGDAFLLEWGEKDDEHSILIDSGIPGTYRYIKTDIKALKKFEAVILTHIDYDHLGGFFKLLDDESVPLSKDVPVYMNTPSLVLTPQSDDKVDFEHGIKLDKKLDDLGISCKPLYDGFATGNLLEVIFSLYGIRH